jgi:hypothetical protein
MPGPTQLNITIATAALPSGLSNPISVPIPAGLIAADSNAMGGQGQASVQSGFSSVDTAIRNIFKQGGFFVTNSVWISAYFIQSITWS